MTFTFAFNVLTDRKTKRSGSSCRYRMGQDECTACGESTGRNPDIVRTLDFHVHPHLLRHTCATRWVEQGFTVKEVKYMLGHSTPDLTMRVYAHYDSAGQLSETTSKMRALM